MKSNVKDEEEENIDIDIVTEISVIQGKLNILQDLQRDTNKNLEKLNRQIELVHQGLNALRIKDEERQFLERPIFSRNRVDRSVSLSANETETSARKNNNKVAEITERIIKKDKNKFEAGDIVIVTTNYKNRKGKKGTVTKPVRKGGIYVHIVLEETNEEIRVSKGNLKHQ